MLNETDLGTTDALLRFARGMSASLKQVGTTFHLKLPVDGRRHEKPGQATEARLKAL